MDTPMGTDDVVATSDWQGIKNGYFDGDTDVSLNVAGHLARKGTTSSGTPVIQRQDIWKFNADEYLQKWLEKDPGYKKMPLFMKKAAKWGLQEVDRLGTPVISRTKWHKGWL